jgi:PilZ domain
MKYTPDARAEPREHVCLPARITSNNGFTVIGCVIRNFSTAGANLVLANKDEELPEEFDLQIPLRATSYRVALIWRNDDTCGVRFLRKLHHAASR